MCRVSPCILNVRHHPPSIDRYLVSTIQSIVIQIFDLFDRVTDLPLSLRDSLPRQLSNKYNTFVLLAIFEPSNYFLSSK